MKTDTKSLGELLREKLDGRISPKTNFGIVDIETAAGSFVDLEQGFQRFPRFEPSVAISKTGIGPDKRKTVNIVKRSSNMYFNSKVLVSINGSNNLVVDLNTELLNVLSSAKVAKVDRDWDGNIKTVQYTNDKPTICIVDASDILAAKIDNGSKIKALEELQEKLKAETDAVAKQIQALSND
jgi:hypothetical protein